MAESRKWSKLSSGNPWNNDRVCETSPGIHCSFAGFTTIWDGPVANTSPLGYQKSIQCWKTITMMHHIIFWLYLYFFNILYFFKYSYTNIFHRRSLCTFYTNSFIAIYPFYVENIEFLIKIINELEPLYRINGFLVIIYDSHIVKWQPYCKHLNILIVQ